MKKKVSIVTLGCAKNTADTDNLARVLKAQGHDVVADAKDADAIVVHTCSFIEAAKKESIDTILQAGQLKTKGKKLIVTGCLVQQHGTEIFKSLPEVDAFLGTGQLGQLAGLLDKPRKRFIDRANPGGFMDPDLPSPRRTPGSSPTSAYLRLSEGCSHPCSFCVIPRLRGPVQSRSEEQILRESRDLAANGVEEISIIAQDTGDWGRNFSVIPAKAGIQSNVLDPGFRRGDGQKLPKLLRSLAQVPGIRWIRLMYMHPASMTDEVLNVLAADPEKFVYLDMPFQHIDSKMLSEMKRKMDEKGLRDLLERIHKKAPRLTLRTTFIVGAPGESAAQFKRLVNFVKEGHFDYLGAFSYSKEEKTPMAGRKNQVTRAVKAKRLEELTQVYYGVAHAKASHRLGFTETILLEDTEGDTVLGRTRREAPEIDAVVRLPKKAAREGRFITAKLTGYDSYEFSGVPLENLPV